YRMSFPEITKEEDKSSGIDYFNKLMSGQIKNAAFEKRYICKDGTVINAFITASLLYDEKKKPLYYFAQVQDITQRMKSETKRKELETQLQQAQKLESIGRLAGGVAHDFNNMLTVIIGYAELSLSKIDIQDPMHDELGRIYKAALRSADITRQLLAFSRQQAIVPIVLNPNEVIESMLKMIRRLIGENISLVWKPSTDVWKIWLDPS
ncbi:MAG: PAS domain S-box protein, partial [Calditrichaeota bacterium]|nr:PAS domain S-box protein [Calditrichota bacterium]